MGADGCNAGKFDEHRSLQGCLDVNRFRSLLIYDPAFVGSFFIKKCDTFVMVFCFTGLQEGLCHDLVS